MKDLEDLKLNMNILKSQEENILSDMIELIDEFTLKPKFSYMYMRKKEKGGIEFLSEPKEGFSPCVILDLKTPIHKMVNSRSFIIALSNLKGTFKVLYKKKPKDTSDKEEMKKKSFRYMIITL